MALNFANNGVAAMTCNLPPTTLPSDGINNAFGSAVALGTLNCNGAAHINGTTFPAATEDWFVFTWSPGPFCSQITLSLSASNGIQFDVRTDAATNVASAATTVVNLTTSGTYYLRIYGATSSAIGIWGMDLAVH
jgi:hypothetical protein